ncbi:2S seed storage albumin protein-like [Ricinus communis]|uniref:2S sulfur-rich seed storage protein large subunit, putative n=1 Tax=Ricinus communis TaxID=3988 RepID=B9SA37_RICCO|nr:2S seed storage albumin protein-like [Ricinus communis]EEF39554.1 2S sulfur-rich seed storage protein precursor large subunit, putative [Ricinus communis]|eukprot:XP_002522856.1 2S albumin-like [Ricinus communis]
MAKLAILLASFIALLFLVDASIYRTTVIVDAEDANNILRQDIHQQQRGSCSAEIEKQQNLWRCQQYIKKEVTGWGPRMDYYPLCCDHLEQMTSQCRCEGLRQAIQKQQSEGQIEGEDVREAFRIAQDLPSRCGVSPSPCQFEPGLGF